MARERELKEYNVIYSTRTDSIIYQTYKFTKEELEKLWVALDEGKRGIRTNFGYLVLTDVRAVVEYKEPPPQEEVKEESQMTTGIPSGDMQIMAYLRQLEKEAEDAVHEGRYF